MVSTSFRLWDSPPSSVFVFSWPTIYLIVSFSASSHSHWQNHKQVNYILGHNWSTWKPRVEVLYAIGNIICYRKCHFPHTFQFSPLSDAVLPAKKDLLFLVTSINEFSCHCFFFSFWIMVAASYAGLLHFGVIINLTKHMGSLNGLTIKKLLNLSRFTSSRIKLHISIIWTLNILTKYQRTRFDIY